MKKNLLTTTLGARVQTRIIDSRTGLVLRASRWTKNLVFDSGLNKLAGSGSSFADFFNYCKIGSSAAPNSYGGGLITFTQSGTTITASGPFFTSAMTGGIMKYGTGTGGQEVYITYVSSTVATASTSYSIVASAGTVWQVQQTQLSALLYASDTYDTTAGACVTSYSNYTATMQRTIKFPTQATTYTVNEIGYFDNGTGATVNGRIVLPSPDVVTPTQFYVVVIQMTYVVQPSNGTTGVTVGDVGGGSPNTSGKVGYNFWDCKVVDTSGNSVNKQPLFPTGLMDASGGTSLTLAFLYSGTWTFPANIDTGNSYNQNTNVLTTGAFSSFTNAGQPVGVGQAVLSLSVSASAQTVSTFIFGGLVTTNQLYPILAQILTTPFTLPSGTYAKIVTLSLTFTRTLSN